MLRLILAIKRLFCSHKFKRGSTTKYHKKNWRGYDIVVVTNYLYCEKCGMPVKSTSTKRKV